MATLIKTIIYWIDHEDNLTASDIEDEILNCRYLPTPHMFDIEYSNQFEWTDDCILNKSSGQNKEIFENFLKEHKN